MSALLRRLVQQKPLAISREETSILFAEAGFPKTYTITAGERAGKLLVSRFGSRLQPARALYQVPRPGSGSAVPCQRHFVPDMVLRFVGELLF
jgi:hypothetical protein